MKKEKTLVIQLSHFFSSVSDFIIKVTQSMMNDIPTEFMPVIQKESE